MKIYIYLIRSKINNKCYVGQTVNYEKRMKEHVYGRNNNRNSIIDRAIKKYGKENFIFSIINIADNQKTADFLERKYILDFNCIKPRGYNILRGGRNQQGSWNQKKVYMYDLNGNYIMEFESSMEVERQLGLKVGSYKNIYKKLDKNKIAYNFYWKRVNKDNHVPSLS